MSINNICRVAVDPIRENDSDKKEKEKTTSEELLYYIMLMLYVHSEKNFQNNEKFLVKDGESFMDYYNELTKKIQGINKELLELGPKYDKAKVKPDDINKLIELRGQYEKIRMELYSAQAEQEMARGKTSNEVNLGLKNFESMWRSFADMASSAVTSFKDLIYYLNNKK